jgi:hypothetical protein
VLKILALAFQQILPGEQMPDPMSDPSFKKYADDYDFEALVNSLKRRFPKVTCRCDGDRLHL